MQAATWFPAEEEVAFQALVRWTSILPWALRAQLRGEDALPQQALVTSLTPPFAPRYRPAPSL